MFPKSFLDTKNIATLREHAVNIPGILGAGWVISNVYFKKLMILQQCLK